MANTEQTQTPTGPSLAVQIGMLAAMTAAALGVGWMAGSYLRGTEAPAAAAKTADAEAEPASQEESVAATLVELAPITTNLAAPADVWVRMDASLVFDAPPPPDMAEAVHQDLLAFLRTVRMHQVEGASGFQHLKADLKERAAIRSDGRVTNVLIRTLLFE